MNRKTEEGADMAFPLSARCFKSRTPFLLKSGRRTLPARILTKRRESLLLAHILT
jgi:hypothetical protein